MTEVQTPHPGTREYYAQREVLENPRKKLLLKRIYHKILRQVAVTLAENDRPTEEDLSDMGRLKTNYKFLEAWDLRDEDALLERVRKNVFSKQMAQLLYPLGGDKERKIEPHPVYQFILDAQDRVYDYFPVTEGLSTSLDPDYVQSIFLESWKDGFLARGVPSGRYDAETDEDIEDGYNTPMERFALLEKMANLQGEQRELLFQKLIPNLPYAMGAQLMWHDLVEIYEDVVNPREKKGRVLGEVSVPF